MLLGSAIKNNLPCNLGWRDKLASVENKVDSSLHLFSVTLTVMTNWRATILAQFLGEHCSF